MSGLRKWVLAIVASLAVAFVAPAAAQGAPEIVGDWNGSLSIPATDIPLIVRVTRDTNGSLEGTLEDYERNPGNPVAMSEIGLEGRRFVFRVASISASYEGTWDEAAQQWKGTFNQGAALPLDLARGGLPPKPVIAGLDGVWVGSIERNGVRLRQVVSVRTVGQGTFALYSSPDQLVTGIPISDLARNGREVTMTTSRGLAKFAGTLSVDGAELTGTWTLPNQPEATLTYTRATAEEIAARRSPVRPQTPREPFPYKVEEVAFDNPAFSEVHLAGTLTLPEGEGPFPAAIMITGSGGQDRDETLLDHKPFAVIADHLTRNGIAVLRFDDRGVGQSTGDYATATSADLATDANAAFAYLAARPEIRREAIGFIGHSEGGVIGPIAMASNPEVAYLVSLAGPGTSLIPLLLSQRRLVFTQMGLTPELIDKQEPVMRALFEAVGGAETPEAGRAAALAVMTPEAREALGMPAEMSPDLVVQQISGPWYQYVFKYDPAAYWGRIEVPVLALNGSLDLQVPPKENLAAIRAALTDNPDATISELPGLNHLFQTATTGAVGEYRDIEETFAPTALELMSQWISERFVKP